MKRSEMVKLMSNYLIAHAFMAQKEAVRHANAILTNQEEAGLMPPARIGTIKYGLEGNAIHESIFVSWEPEDETQ